MTKYLINVKAEGTEFVFVHSKHHIEDVSRYSLPTDELENIKSGIETRFALFRWHLPPYKLKPYILVWQKCIDLLKLENRLINDQYQDSDFENAFRTYYKVLQCPECQREVKALCIDAGDPYPLNKHLHREKIQMLEVKKCPYCSSSLRQLVVKIVEP